MNASSADLRSHVVDGIVDETPVPVGVDELDKLMNGGAYPGDVNVLAGTLGGGKTSAILSLLIAAVNSGKKCFYFHGEYTRATLLQRVRGLVGGAAFNPENLVSCQFPINKATANDLQNEIVGKKLDFIFVDTLDLLENKVSPMENREGRKAAVTGNLRELAQTNGVVVWATTSIKRGQVAATSMRPDFVELPEAIFQISLGPDQSQLLSPVKARRWSFSEGEAVKLVRPAQVT